MEATRSEFINTISKQFEAWCEENNLVSSASLFAEYLVNRSLICDKIIKRFLVIDKYPKLLQQNMEIKREAVWDLEEIVNLKEGQINNILRDYSSSFFLRERTSGKNCT